MREVLEELLRRAQEQSKTAGEICTTTDLGKYGLGGVDCALCGNSGTLTEVRDGILYARECSCMKQRRSLRNVQRSCVGGLMDKYSFGNYDTSAPEYKRLVEKGKEFIGSRDKWLYICGRPGSGKTHLCIAICSELLKSHEVKYMVWRDVAPRLKAAVNDTGEYMSILAPLKNAEILYIDDFLKGSANPADINLAFELINSRYNNNLRTIISTERNLEEILSLDEALGSRIREKSKGFCLSTPEINWRLKK